VRRRMSQLVVLAFTLGLAGAARAQQKLSPSELKVQIVFSEFEGEKKVSSLPYSFTAVGGEDEHEVYQASLRLGISVPILTQNKEGSPQMQYQDVGTNIDCRAKRYEDGRYKLNFNIERSSIYAPGGSEKDEFQARALGSSSPLLRRYRGAFDVLLRDGQTTQGPVATDPQSGRVLKTEVTINVAR